MRVAVRMGMGLGMGTFVTMTGFQGWSWIEAEWVDVV